MCIRDSTDTARTTPLRRAGGWGAWGNRAVQSRSGRRRNACLLYTSDAADERSSVDLGGRRIIKKKKRLIIRDT